MIIYLAILAAVMAFVAAHPEYIAPRPWSWRVTYGVAFVVWLALVVVTWG